MREPRPQKRDEKGENGVQSKEHGKVLAAR